MKFSSAKMKKGRATSRDVSMPKMSKSFSAMERRNQMSKEIFNGFTVMWVSKASCQDFKGI